MTNDDKPMTSSPYSIRIVNWQHESKAISALRREVFIDEQGVSEEEEWDGRDESAVHFVLRGTEDSILGTARVLLEHGPEGAACHIGRVAVRKLYRNHGLGGALMRAIMDWCQRNHPEALIYLHAQTQRLAFYQRLGFQPRGPEFMDAGIPHREMFLPQE